MNERVLFVDDDKSVLKTLVRMGNHIGLNVTTATSGAECLIKVQQNKPDLIVMDICLGDTTGLIILKRLMEDRETQKIPVILISGIMTDPDSIISGYEAGAVEYLHKPFHHEILSAKIDSIFKREKLLAEKQEEIIERGDVRIDNIRREIRINKCKVENLSAKEAELFCFLFCRPNETVLIKEILEKIWDDREQIYMNTLYAHISSLRSKLPAGISVKIRTYPKIGYTYMEQDNCSTI